MEPVHCLHVHRIIECIGHSFTRALAQINVLCKKGAGLHRLFLYLLLRYMYLVLPRAAGAGRRALRPRNAESTMAAEVDVGEPADTPKKTGLDRLEEGSASSKFSSHLPEKSTPHTLQSASSGSFSKMSSRVFDQGASMSSGLSSVTNKLRACAGPCKDV